MKTIEELKFEENELATRIDELSAARGKLRQEIADLLAPFKIGDRVTEDDGKTVYEVTAIRPNYGNNVKLFGVKIKKNGEPGLLVTHLYAWGNTSFKLAAKP